MPLPQLDQLENSALLAGLVMPAGQTGVTQLYNGLLTEGLFKCSIDFSGCVTAGVTQDFTLATIPAKARIKAVIADTLTAWTGEAGTCVLTVGKTAGGAEYIASHDVKSATVTKGLADADMGTALTRAAAINGGDIPSWTTTTTLQARITSGTGNVTTITAGKTNIYVLVEFYQGP